MALYNRKVAGRVDLTKPSASFPVQCKCPCPSRVRERDIPLVFFGFGELKVPFEPICRH
jgi:hypothetical protein